MTIVVTQTAGGAKGTIDAKNALADKLISGAAEEKDHPAVRCVMLAEAVTQV